MKYCKWADSKNVCGNILSTDNPITCCLQNSNLLIISIHSELDVCCLDSLKVHPDLYNYSTMFAPCVQCLKALGYTCAVHTEVNEVFAYDRAIF